MTFTPACQSLISSVENAARSARNKIEGVVDRMDDIISDFKQRGETLASEAGYRCSQLRVYSWPNPLLRNRRFDFATKSPDTCETVFRHIVKDTGGILNCFLSWLTSRGRIWYRFRTSLDKRICLHSCKPTSTYYKCSHSTLIINYVPYTSSCSDRHSDALL